MEMITKKLMYNNGNSLSNFSSDNSETNRIDLNEGNQQNNGENNNCC